MEQKLLGEYQMVMDTGYIFQGRNKRNRVVLEKYGYYSVSRLVYCLFHPNEPPLDPKEEIHHDDFCSWNDHPDNLIRVSKQKHKAIHMQRQQATISPIIINQIRRLWLAEVRGYKIIWYELAKVVGYKMIKTIIKHNKEKWATS
jgi:hypothetical protein